MEVKIVIMMIKRIVLKILEKKIEDCLNVVIFVTPTIFFKWSSKLISD